MKTIRISGLVKTATQMRQELSGPLSGERKAVLQKRVRNALQQIDEILKRESATVNTLPAPSRKAYMFLSTLDFDAINCSGSSSGDGHPVSSVSFRGLRRSLQGILDQWAMARKEGRFQDVYEHIRSHSEHLEELIREDSISAEQLTLETREIRGWLAYFAQRNHFDDYVMALQTATPCFIDAARALPKLPNEISIHFKPMRGIYSSKTYRNLLLVKMPTPMVSFDRHTFELLARLAIQKNGQKQPIMEAMLDESYQMVLGELELLAGVADKSKGVWHDLAQSFERVNSTYFENAMNQPRLVWSQVFTSRKFGHYDQAHDTIMISATLDGNEVPELVVDFIMYHELLHKKLGVIWTNGRKLAHSADFLREERRYPDYDKAQAVLKKLAGVSHSQHHPDHREKSRQHTEPKMKPESTKAACITNPSRVGRNSPCPCGSGRKYKKCCGK